MAKPRAEKSVLFRVLAAPAVLFIGRIARLEVQDAEKLPREGSFVLTPNHFSNIDPVIMGWSVWMLGRAPRFLAKESLFRVPVLGAALRAIGQIPVERSGRARRPAAASGHAESPLTAARNLATVGDCIIVYPEGTLTREPDLWPMRGKSGAVRIALDNGLDLIPAAHWGDQAVLPRSGGRLSLFPRKTVLVKYGDPVDLTPYRGIPMTQALYTEATEKVMTAITELLEDLRGEKAPPGRWNPADHAQTEYGRP